MNKISFIFLCEAAMDQFYCSAVFSIIDYYLILHSCTLTQNDDIFYFQIDLLGHMLLCTIPDDQGSMKTLELPENVLWFINSIYFDSSLDLLFL